MSLSKEMAELVKLANKFDASGMVEAAQQLDATLVKLAAEAEQEAEEEKKGRELSGKAKAKLRACVKAAQSLVDADLDMRGADKKACKKIEDLAEQILEAAKDCSFMSQGE